MTLAFGTAGAGVINLDETADAMQVFDCSTCIRIGGVTLGSSEMQAASVDELKAALAKAKVRPFDPEAI